MFSAQGLFKFTDFFEVDKTRGDFIHGEIFMGQVRIFWFSKNERFLEFCLKANVIDVETYFRGVF